MRKGPVLILEDDVLIALDMQMTLDAGGIEDVVVCNTCAQARSFLAADTPRLAFLDINLGGDVSGLDIGIELVARGCCVVIVSGYTDATVSLPQELQGAPRLSKPFAERELLSLAMPA